MKDKKRPLLEALKRIGGKLPLNEAYRDPKDNIELVQLWLTSPAINDSERAHIMEQLVGWGLLDHMAQWDDLDEAVEHVLDDLGGSAIENKYLPADMHMDIDESLNEKKDASWTWDELNDTLFNHMNMPPRKIADIRTALKRHTRK